MWGAPTPVVELVSGNGCAPPIRHSWRLTPPTAFNVGRRGALPRADSRPLAGSLTTQESREAHRRCDLGPAGSSPRSGAQASGRPGELGRLPASAGGEGV